MPVWQVMQHPRRTGWGGRIGTQLGRERRGWVKRPKATAWLGSLDMTHCCPSGLGWMPDGSTSTDSPAVNFLLLLPAGTWGSQPITHDTTVTHCLCHTHSPTACTKVLFAIPIAEFACAIPTAALAANLHKIRGRHSYVILTTDESLGGLQITQKLYSSKWDYQKANSTQLQDVHCLVPKPETPQMTILARKKRSVRASFHSKISRDMNLPILPF